MKAAAMIARYTNTPLPEVLNMNERMFNALAKVVREILSEEFEAQANTIAYGISKAFSKRR